MSWADEDGGDMDFSGTVPGMGQLPSRENTVKISSIPLEISENDMAECVYELENIEPIEMRFEEAGDSKIGYLTFEKNQDVQKCLKLDGLEIMDCHTLKVELYDVSRTRSRPKMQRPQPPVHNNLRSLRPPPLGQSNRQVESFRAPQNSTRVDESRQRQFIQVDDSRRRQQRNAPSQPSVNTVPVASSTNVLGRGATSNFSSSRPQSRPTKSTLPSHRDRFVDVDAEGFCSSMTARAAKEKRKIRIKENKSLYNQRMRAPQAMRNERTMMRSDRFMHRRNDGGQFKTNQVNKYSTKPREKVIQKEKKKNQTKIHNRFDLLALGGDSGDSDNSDESN